MALASTFGLLAGGILGFYVATVLIVTVWAIVVVEYLRRVMGWSITQCAVGIAAGFRRLGNVVSFSILFYAAAFTYQGAFLITRYSVCLLYTSDASDERSSVDLGGPRIIKKKNKDKQ